MNPLDPSQFNFGRSVLSPGSDAQMQLWALMNGRVANRGWEQAPPVGDTRLTPEQEAQYFLQWKPQNAPRDSGYDYDNRGAFLASLAGNLPPRDERGHGTDTFKKPWHPTYSTGSAMSAPFGMTPGAWGEGIGGKTMFTPGTANTTYHSIKDLVDYFGAVEPNATLNMPGARY